ncbi:hypothetical protein PG987_006911 [Apiospora arundinis]
MAKRKPTPKQLERMLSGGGGGHDLPSIREVLASDHGFGTYRGKFNSIATLGLELPVLNIAGGNQEMPDKQKELPVYF